MLLDVSDGSETQQLLLFDPNPEIGVRFDQDFVEPQGIDPDVLHQPGLWGDHSWISAGDAVQDLDQPSLQLLLVGAALCQRAIS